MTTRMFAVNGADISVDEAGAGPPVVLLHAGIADRSMWDPQWRALASVGRVVRLDLRGFGDSTLPSGIFSHHADVCAMLDLLGIERAAVVGLSMGGGVALDVALTHADRISALVLASTLAGSPERGTEIRQVWQESEAAAGRGDLDLATELELRLWVDGVGRSPAEVDTGVRERARAMNRRCWEREVADAHVGATEEPLDPPACTRLAEIAVPTLIMVGDLDLPDVQASVDALAAGIQGAERVVIAQAAHLPNLERPEAFNRALIPFLARANTARDRQP